MAEASIWCVHGELQAETLFPGTPITVVSSAPLADIIRNQEATGRVAKWAIELGPADVKHTPIGRPQEEGMMQSSSKFSLSMKPRFNRTSRSSSASEGCQRRIMMRRNTRESGADVEPAHNTIKLLCPNETVRLSISPAC